MYLFLALATAALAVLFWRITVRIVLIVIIFLLVLGLATLVRDMTREQGTTGTTTAEAATTAPR